MPALIFRKGLDLKHEVAGVLSQSYHSALVNQIKAEDYRLDAGRLTIHLAREFGFCYGVDRAVDYAYQARLRFPAQRVFLTGEIIHNPHVNDQLRQQGIRILTDDGENRDRLGPDDVVILPAFGVSVAVTLVGHVRLLNRIQPNECKEAAQVVKQFHRANHETGLAQC